jgi:hypothetical protein
MLYNNKSQLLLHHYMPSHLIINGTASLGVIRLVNFVFYTPDHVTPTTHQLFNFKIPEKPSITQLFSIPLFPPGNKLLLESDSPHLHDVAGSVNHPAHLFRVAEEVLPMGEPCTGGSREIGPRGRIS